MRAKLNTDINDLLKEFLFSAESKYNKSYIGKVVNNKDPDKTGKCKIRVYGVFENEIPDADLPWAILDNTFIGSLKGSFIVPPIGAIVKVYFDNGDIYHPRYSTKVIDTNNLSSDRLKNYPHTMIFFETDQGDKLTIDRSSGELLFTHRSGVTFSINSSGYEMKHQSGSFIKLKQNGDIDIDSKKNINIKHNGFLIDNGSNVIPSNKGPFNCLPICPVLGISHAGQRCAPGI